MILCQAVRDAISKRLARYSNL